MTTTLSADNLDMHFMFKKHFSTSFIALCLSLFFLVACGELKSANLIIGSIEERVSPDVNGLSEPSYCSGTLNFSNSVTISGTANFKYRNIEYSGTFKGLGDVEAASSPIRFAEVIVLNNLNNVIQCGETDANGNFTLSMPNDGAIYRLRVNSRADNTNYKASVLRAPETNDLYYLESIFISNQNRSFNLLAEATGDLKGGAFHLLDQILVYNEKLRELAGTCGGSTLCNEFTVAPKVNIYWEKGFNPGSYLPGDPVSSFFYQDTNRLFILGGIDGDTDYTDTDHFDKSIIAHEYFHFLESSVGRTHSPGGAHNGNQIIDPRLAWSEGAAQFFQGVMNSISRVLDSRGNKSGASNLIIDFSIETSDTDIPQYTGEGEYREFSVARALWDSFDDTPFETFSSGACDQSNVHDRCAKNSFSHFWSVLTGNWAFNNLSERFISIGLFHSKFDEIAAEANGGSIPNRHQLLPIRSYESQAPNRSFFAQRLQACTSAQTFSFGAPFVFNATGQLRNSHMLKNNRFHHFTHNGGFLNLILEYSFTGGLTADVDLYLYPENFVHGSEPIGADLVGTSKSISQPNLAPGNYMIGINVKNFNTSSSGTIQYTLKDPGDLCASN